ncbi:MAG TPA: glycoside hydrolase family 16 protein [Fodinibius sp.]|nr:glycoside hydrolase family 16 protein [Fodinibius sp.]
MLKIYSDTKVCILLLIVFASLTACKTTEEHISDEWQLIWQDEFTGSGQPDNNKWAFAPRRSPDWARFCTESTETVEVQDGKLYLRGMLNSSEKDTAEYQTGCIHTKNKFAFKYGKVEIKAKLAEGKGSWPAIWMMSSDSSYGDWPRSGEIDIMEHLNFDKKVYQTVHSSYVDLQNKKDDPQYSTTASILPGEFNVFGLEWYPDRLEFFVNGSKTLTYPRKPGAGSDQWPFDQHFYLILDQALGGSWVGRIDDEDLPVEMAIDWVRVYKAE